MKQATKVATRSAPGTIEPHVLYTLPEIQSRSRLGTWALRALRRSGLRVLRVGGRAFVKGDDFIAAIEAAAKKTKD